jgi:hypothetical protein
VQGGDDEVQEGHDGEQHGAERQRQREVALAGLERDGGGHHACDAIDVAADDHHRAHFGDGASERGERDGQHGAPLMQQHQQRRGIPPGAERTKLLATFDERILHQPARQRGDQRQHQHRLRDDHRGRRKQQAIGAERPGSREQQVDAQPDDHRRQRQQRVQRPDQAALPRKARHGQPGAERQPHQCAQRTGGQADAQRQPDDAPQLGIALRDQAPGEERAVEEGGHPAILRERQGRMPRGSQWRPGRPAKAPARLGCSAQ